MSERSKKSPARRERLFSLLCLVVSLSLGLSILSGCGSANGEKAAQQDSGGDQGSGTNWTTPATARNTTQDTAQATAPAPGAARGTLDGLRVAPAGSMSGYSRESFEHWSRANDFGWDVPESSCDAREAALIRDSEDVEVGSGCKVTRGEWFDPYTAQTFTEPSDIDIDHVVPLANAYRSGASEWSDEERER